MEKTLIILKPDCLARRLIGRIIQRFEDKGLQLAAIRLMQVDRPLAERHYEMHRGKDFYADLIAYITRGPVVAMVVAGPRAVSVCRKLVGATFGFNAEPGSIRGDFGLSTTYNLVHASDTPENAAREIALYFSPQEIFENIPPDAAWLTKPGEMC